jgi:hypothetical protein
MPHEEIKIIVQQDGDLRIELPGLDPVRLRYYREMFEEVFGKIKEERQVGDMQPPPGVKITTPDQIDLKNRSS